MVTLSEYLALSDITQRDLAASVGISPSFLNEIVRGLKSPRLEVALRIHAATGGKVDIQSLVKNPSSSTAPENAEAS